MDHLEVLIRTGPWLPSTSLATQACDSGSLFASHEFADSVCLKICGLDGRYRDKGRESERKRETKGRFAPTGRANSPWRRLHEILAFLGLEAGLNYTL